MPPATAFNNSTPAVSTAKKPHRDTEWVSNLRRELRDTTLLLEALGTELAKTLRNLPVIEESWLKQHRQLSNFWVLLFHNLTYFEDMYLHGRSELDPRPERKYRVDLLLDDPWLLEYCVRDLKEYVSRSYNYAGMTLDLLSRAWVLEDAEVTRGFDDGTRKSLVRKICSEMGLKLTMLEVLETYFGEEGGTSEYLDKSLE